MTLRPKALATLLAATLAGAAAPLCAAGWAPYSITVLVDGAPAPEYASRGRIYIEALKGRNFSVRISNPTSERVAVALSVDGRNVIDAKRTSASDASKWILMPGQTAEIPGWQISGDTSRRFFFTETRRSYAKWLGDTSNVGTIEAVFYRELRPIAATPAYPRPLFEKRRREAEENSAPEDQASAQDRARAGSSLESGVPSSPPVTVRGEAPIIDPRADQAPEAPSAAGKAAPAPSARLKESDSFAATGIGRRTEFSVQWIRFEEDPTPAARVALRYEFRAELVRLGVLRSEDDLYARDRGRGFEREYAPDPYRDR